MLCCFCKKEAHTNIVESIKDGKKQREYYCADCFRRLFGSSMQKKEQKTLVCAACGTKKEDFLRSGLVGCQRCYTYLYPVIEPMILRTQGSEKHVGKRPVTAESKQQVLARRAALRAEVEKRQKQRDYKRAGEFLAELKDLNQALGKEEVES